MPRPPIANNPFTNYDRTLSARRRHLNKAIHKKWLACLRRHGHHQLADDIGDLYRHGGRDPGDNNDYQRAVAQASMVLTPGDGIPALPVRSISTEEHVRDEAFDMFFELANLLFAGWGEERRLLFLTVTCEHLAGPEWQDYYNDVTARRDILMKCLNRHKVWSASIFDVQDRTADYHPHWHILFITDAPRVGELLRVVENIRTSHAGRLVGNVDVRHVDHEEANLGRILRNTFERKTNWIRTLRYVTRIWSHGRYMDFPPDLVDWAEIVRPLYREPSFTEETGDKAIRARAILRARTHKAKFCHKDTKIKPRGGVRQLA